MQKLEVHDKSVINLIAIPGLEIRNGKAPTRDASLLSTGPGTGRLALGVAAGAEPEEPEAETGPGPQRERCSHRTGSIHGGGGAASGGRGGVESGPHWYQLRYGLRGRSAHELSEDFSEDQPECSFAI